MNDDEMILLAAQEQPVEENENYVVRKAMRLAAIVAICLVIAMFLVEAFAFRKFEFGKPLILTIVAAIIDLYEGRELNKKGMRVRGAVEVAFAIFLLILYVGGLFR